jgi:hypothetical protein
MAKSQSTIEYLVIVALTLGVLVPAAYLFFSQSSESNARIVESQVNALGTRIIDNAESIYFSGEGSKVTLEIEVPEDVRDINITENRELIFRVKTEAGESELIFFSSIDLISDDCTGNVCKLDTIATQGKNVVKIESVNNGDQVKISKFVRP